MQRQSQPTPLIRVRSPRPEEAESLTAIVLRSKASWDYSAEFMEQCREELTVTTDDMQTQIMRVAVQTVGDGVHRETLVGMASLKAIDTVTADLTGLFIEPDAQGQGFGRLLFGEIVDAAREAGFHQLSIDSDPGAQPFYERMGAVLVGRTPSGSILGRYLPLMRYDINASAVAP